jgi:hypothetical protein
VPQRTSAYVGLFDYGEVTSGARVANTVHDVIIPGLHNNIN